MKTNAANQLAVIPAVPEAIAEAAREELARRELLAFCERMIPGFQSPSHIRYIAGLLESVERGDQRRLLISTHPGSGKSWLLQAFGAWYLGRNPRRRIITASAGAEIAERNSRASRNHLLDSKWPFDVELSKSTTAQNRWDTTAGGGMVAVGASGLISGFRSSIIVLDDIQDNQLSQAERESLWSWYRSVLMSRLEPRGSIVVIQQRWSSDDIPARILESGEAKDWLHVALPAIALEDDALGRQPGESLWPHRWPLAELERQKIAMGSRAFECAWQGNPIPLEGALLKSSWFPAYTTPPAEYQRVVCALDSAAKTGISNNYSAIVKVGFSKGKIYVLDVWRAKVEFADLIRRVQALADEDPRPTTIFVEDTSSGQPLIQVLRNEGHLPIVPVKATASKIARVEGICGTLEAGKVLLPKEAPWLNDFLIEALSFPSGRHDDALDAFTICISELTKRKMPANWFFEFGNSDPSTNRFYFGDDDRSPETDEPVGYSGDIAGAIGRVSL